MYKRYSLINPSAYNRQVSAEQSIRSVFQQEGDSILEKDLVESHHYKKGLDDIIDLYKYINKIPHVPSEDHAQFERLPHPGITPYGFDGDAGEGLESMLGNSIVKQIIKYPGEPQNELGDTGFRKNVYIRWDLMCQIINHLSFYKHSDEISLASYFANGGKLKEPLVELTYMNENQRTWSNFPPSNGLEGTLENPAYAGSKFYLRYGVPGALISDPKTDLLDYWKKPDPVNLERNPEGQVIEIQGQETEDERLRRQLSEEEYDMYQYQKTYSNSYSGPYHPQLGSSMFITSYDYFL